MIKKVSILKLGNYQSIVNFIKSLDQPYDTKLTLNKNDVAYSDIVLIPGVGNFQGHMESIEHYGLKDVLKGLYFKNKLIIGICAGMQIFFQGSEEARMEGIGLLEGNIYALNNFHNQWNQVNFQDDKFRNLNGNYYFNHKYAYLLNEKYKIGHTYYGDTKIISVINSRRLFGFQFHPEKSQNMGFKLLSYIINKF